MPNAKYDGSKSHVNISTIGDVDYGKTTLTAAITKVLSQRVAGNTEVTFESIDEAEEEMESGMPIFASRVEYKTNNRYYAHVDYRRHVDYVKDRITDAARMDGAILVLDATDRVMAQIEEQIRQANGATRLWNLWKQLINGFQIHSVR